MKKILTVFFALSVSLIAQVYPTVTIQDIQFLSDSTLSTVGDSPSPLVGDTVIVTGVALVSTVVDPQTDRRPIIWAGNRWVSYVVDEQDIIWGGMNLIQHDTTGDNQLTFFQNVDSADVIQFVAVIEEYINTTQASILLNPLSEVEVIDQLDKRPDPIELSISDFMENGELKADAEKYEGSYVVIREGITSDRNNSNGTFKINDENGNFVWMYDQSGYFTKRGHRLSGITDYEAPLDGSSVVMIRGSVQTRSDGFYIIPFYPGDLITSFEAPNVSTVDRDKAYASTSETMEVSSTITDADGTVESAYIYYSLNVAAYDSVSMVNTTADNFTGIIPAFSDDGSVVKYFVGAYDNSGNWSSNPQDTSSSPYFYLVKNGEISIQDVRYSPFGNGYSSFFGFDVTVKGIVTADSEDLGGAVYIQNGAEPWSGIKIAGVQTLDLHRGDSIEVTGTVTSSFGVSIIGTVDDGAEVNLISQFNALPLPIVLSTNTIGDKLSGDVVAEQYESVLISYENVFVVNANADGPSNNYGEMLIDDNYGPTRVELQDGNHIYHNLWDPSLADSLGLIEIKNGDQFSAITGILYYSFGDYKLLPRENDDFQGYTSDVQRISLSPINFSLSQNYPNPFNPSTIIKFSLPESNVVKLKVFDILGREVAVLLNENMNSGSYEVKFDASSLSSGIYFYSVQAGEFNEVKKMILIK